jgi:ABC-type bacteriocin/lantibiotic exporter with double-glycine peptidase domain
MNRIDDVSRNPEDPIYQQTGQTDAQRRMVKLSGKVELKNVTFGYSPLDRPLIEDFSLVVEPGRGVALVGASGSGKSTVAKVISGLYQPWKGEVYFDDQPRQAWPRELLVNSLSVVDQEVFLFNGTVSENISMWDPTSAVPRVT